MKLRTLGWIATAGLALGAAEGAAAQAWNYPAFQAPRIEQREYNFGLAAGGDAGTSLFVQWRERLGTSTQFSFEGGIADPDDAYGDDARVLLGGGLALGVARASQTQPLDIVVTGGVYPSFGGDLTIIRVPFGAVLGHRFVPQGSNIAISPFLHPRVALDICAGGDICDAVDDETEINVNFDLGADLELNRNLSLRAAIVFPGDSFDDTGFGLSLAWRPAGLGR